jgi:hypothetical protein
MFGNVCQQIDKLPKKEQAEAAARLRAIQRASSRSVASADRPSDTNRINGC